MSDRAAAALPAAQFARWVWRQITSMRTALMLLLSLALAAVPGSLVPQQGVDAQKVAGYRLAHPQLTPVLDRLGMFSVYTSVWFSAVYILLMISLVGCIIPRVAVYYRAVRARPPRAPARLDRLSASRRFQTDLTPQEVVRVGRDVLPRRRYRVDIVGGELRAETGYLREMGNLVFHISLLVVLVGVAVGGLYGYRGAVIVTEGDGFSNTVTQYDEFSSGNLFNRADLPQFSLNLADLEAKFQMTGPQRGAPRKFEATGTYSSPGSAPQPFDITVNNPLNIGGTNVFLVGQGYSPTIRVRDGQGQSVFEGAVPFLPRDGTYTSTGVVKAPDASPTQLGFQGFFLPTAVSVNSGPPVSAFPAAANPVLGLFAYYGDLGLDDGTPQSVFVLNKSRLTRITDAKGSPLRLTLSPGQVADLPGGRGSIEFVGVRQFARFQIASSPAAVVPLLGTSVGLLGLVVSLMIRPRRLWIRARRDGDRTVVEVAGLSRVARGDLEAEVDGLVRSFVPESSESSPANSPRGPWRRAPTDARTADGRWGRK